MFIAFQFSQKSIILRAFCALLIVSVMTFSKPADAFSCRNVGTLLLFSVINSCHNIYDFIAQPDMLSMIGEGGLQAFNNYNVDALLERPIAAIIFLAGVGATAYYGATGNQVALVAGSVALESPHRGLHRSYNVNYPDWHERAGTLSVVGTFSKSFFGVFFSKLLAYGITSTTGYFTGHMDIKTAYKRLYGIGAFGTLGVSIGDTFSLNPIMTEIVRDHNPSTPIENAVAFALSRPLYAVIGPIPNRWFVIGVSNEEFGDNFVETSIIAYSRSQAYAIGYGCGVLFPGSVGSLCKLYKHEIALMTGQAVGTYIIWKDGIPTSSLNQSTIELQSTMPSEWPSMMPSEWPSMMPSEWPSMMPSSFTNSSNIFQ